MQFIIITCIMYYLQVTRVDSNAPSDGKDVIDGMFGILKQMLHSRLLARESQKTVENLHDILTSAVAKISGMNYCVLELDMTGKPKQTGAPEAGIRSYLSFEYENNNQIRAWNYYNIGYGEILKEKVISRNNNNNNNNNVTFAFP